RSDWSYSRQFVTRYAVLYFGCRLARLWGSVMHFTVGCWGWSWLKHDARFTRRQERLGYLCTNAAHRGKNHASLRTGNLRRSASSTWKKDQKCGSTVRQDHPSRKWQT